MLCRWTSQKNLKCPSERGDGCFRTSTSCGSWPSTNAVIVTVEVRSCGARGCTRRRSPNGADNVTKAHCMPWGQRAADAQLSRMNGEVARLRQEVARLQAELGKAQRV